MDNRMIISCNKLNIILKSIYDEDDSVNKVMKISQKEGQLIFSLIYNEFMYVSYVDKEKMPEDEFIIYLNNSHIKKLLLFIKYYPKENIEINTENDNCSIGFIISDNISSLFSNEIGVNINISQENIYGLDAPLLTVGPSFSILSDNLRKMLEFCSESNSKIELQLDLKNESLVIKSMNNDTVIETCCKCIKSLEKTLEKRSLLFLNEWIVFIIRCLLKIKTKICNVYFYKNMQFLIICENGTESCIHIHCAHIT